MCLPGFLSAIYVLRLLMIAVDRYRLCKREQHSGQSVMVVVGLVGSKKTGNLEERNDVLSGLIGII